VAPSHEEVLEATEKRAGAMQGLVSDICQKIDVGSFPSPKIAERFAAGAEGVTFSDKPKALPKNTASELPPIFWPLVAGGLAGALVATLLLKK